MKRILIFSGTTEGRRITEFLDGRNVKVYVSAATEYGKECTGEHENAEVLFWTYGSGRADGRDDKGKADRSGDRCNPSICTACDREIRRACQISGVQYLRCLREEMEEAAG